MTVVDASSTQGARKREHANVLLEQECVDDLTIAAQYAFAVPHIVNAHATVTNDDNEIDVSEIATETLEIPKSRGEFSAEHDGTSTDDDAESDVDLTEQLARMVDEGDEEQDTITASTKPLTANEIDVYRANVQEIQDKLEWTTVANETLDGTSTTPTTTPCRRDALTLAGTVQHYMAEERTVVILSHPGGVVLQEGSLLVIAMTDATTESTEIVPIGRILEVFGPVSQPLYSIVIPPPARMREPTASESNSTQVSTPQTTDPVMDTTTGPCQATETQHPTVVGSDVATELRKESADTPWHKDSVTSNAPFTKPDEALTRAPRAVAVFDPSALPPQGVYSSTLLQKSRAVYYTGNDATTVDTATIYRLSGRGCDASNLYDEEIQDGEDFSDDEQERLAKQGRHRKKNATHDSHRGRSVLHPTAQPPPLSGSNPRPEHANYRPYHAGPAPHVTQASGPMIPRAPMPPQGFHEGAAQYMSYQPPPPQVPHHGYQGPSPSPWPPYASYPHQSSPYVSHPHPPAPSVSFPHPPAPYALHPHPPTIPPPPPPRPPNPPDDTVYYDF